jgi:nucleotide-binding universal stress UspA family protein
MYRNILVPTDGSKLSLKAATHAIDLAKSLAAD